MPNEMKITRRDLALGAALLAQAGSAKASDEGHKYTGPLDGFESKVRMEAFDPIAWTLDRHKTAPMKMTFKATTRKQAENWQKSFRSKVTELVGGFPDNRIPLAPQTLDVADFADYLRKFRSAQWDQHVETFLNPPDVEVMESVPQKNAAPELVQLSKKQWESTRSQRRVV